jgi:hypothetical protein
VVELGKKETLADFDFGKGQVAVSNLWRIFLKGMEVLRDKRDMNIFFIAHEHHKPMKDPSLGEYAIYRPKLIDRVWHLTNEWCDAVLFAEFETLLYEKKQEMRRGVVTGARVLHTQRATGFVAKNRYGLPPVMPLDFGEFYGYVKRSAPENLSPLETELAVRLEELGNAALTAKAAAYIEKHGKTSETLKQLINTVVAYINEGNVK